MDENMNVEELANGFVNALVIWLKLLPNLGKHVI